MEDRVNKLITMLQGELLKLYPNEADQITKFLLRHLLPYLSSGNIPWHVLSQELKDILLVLLHTIQTGQTAGIHKAIPSLSRIFMEFCKTDAVKVAAENIATQCVNTTTKSVSKKVTIEITAATAERSTKMIMEETLESSSQLVVKNTSIKVAKCGAKGVVKTGMKTSVKISSKMSTKTVSSEVAKKGTKELAKATMEGAAKAGMTASVVSGVVGGIFLYHDLKKIEAEKQNVTQEEFRKRTNGRIGQYAGEVIGSGLYAGAMVFAGPVGWAAVGASILGGMAVSFIAGQAGNAIGEEI